MDSQVMQVTREDERMHRERERENIYRVIAFIRHVDGWGSRAAILRDFPRAPAQTIKHGV